MKHSKASKDNEDSRNLDEAINQVANGEVVRIKLTKGKVFEQMKKMSGHYQDK